MDSFGTFEATRWILMEICRRYDSPRVLDVGCGSGDLLISLASEIRHGVGIDISRRAVEAAACRSLGFDQLKFQVLAATQLPDRNLGQFETFSSLAPSSTWPIPSSRCKQQWRGRIPRAGLSSW